jgi:YD repeat-containing protein
MKQRHLFLLGIFISTILGSIPAYAQGPVQPEAMQFEPVDVTDVVNLATGDFVYTIPVMSVPGPAGDYPITMSYHSGIGPNQPATWVGLGWTLNAGAINRTLSGYPDDYNGDIVETTYEAASKKGWGLSLGAGWGPVGVNMSYDTESGKVGVNAMVSVFSALGIDAGPFDINVSGGHGGFSANASFSYGTRLAGDLIAGANISAGTSGVGIGGGISRGGREYKEDGKTKFHDNYSLISVGASLTGQGLGGSFSIAGTGFSSVTLNSGGKITSEGFSIRTPNIGGWWASLGYSRWKWTLNDRFNEKSYGVLYQRPNMAADRSINTSFKNERHATEEVLFPSKDAYNVSAQGVSGAFIPVLDYPYNLVDKVNHDERGYIDLYQYKRSFYNKETGVFHDDAAPNRTLKFNSNTPKFRFLDDTGYNFTNKGTYTFQGKYTYSLIDDEYYASKKITPILSPASGKLQGFIITTADGMVYEFMYQINNHFQYSQTEVMDDSKYKNTNALTSPFATSWLLTAIKGPDYIDRGTIGAVDDEDWGYWVKLNYERIPNLQIWRAPYTGYALGEGDDDVETQSYSLGIRDVSYLESIETKTHKAVFDSDYSKNGKNPNVDLNNHDHQINPNITALAEKHQITHKKLNNIKLYNKSDLDNEISKVGFEYDYSLRPNSSGSSAPRSGALTLKSLSFYGQNDYLISPPYRFEYAYGREQGSPYNPRYNKDDHDFWGSYRANSEGLSARFHKNYPHQDKGKADLVAAWSLTGITTPTGSNIQVEYESDDFFHVNNTFYLADGIVKGVNKSASNKQTVQLTSAINETTFEGIGALYLLETETIQETIILEDEFPILSIVKKKYGPYQVSSIDLVNNEITITETLPQFKNDYVDGINKHIFTYSIIGLPTVYGGGSRVRQVATYDGNEQTRTLYTYKDGSVSSGVTASLPADYSEVGTDTGIDNQLELVEEYEAVFMDHKYAYGRPNPGIIYSKVQVINVDENTLPISGMTEYEFYTAKDYPYSPQVINEFRFYIEDRSGMYGKPKATTYYEQYTNEGAMDYRPLKRTEMFYAYSDEVLDSMNVYLNKNTKIDAIDTPIGVTLEAHASYIAIPGGGSGNDHDYAVERTYFNVYGRGQKVTEYFYEDDGSATSSSQLVSQGKTLALNVQTGAPLKTAQQGATDDKVLITESTPAAWKYEAMKDKNMLSQNYQQTSYLVDAHIDDENLKNQPNGSANVLNSSVTTWKEWEADIWRKNDTYSYVTGTPYLEFPATDPGAQSGVYPKVTDTFPWKKTSDIVQYDPYGHAIETVNEDGTYQSVLYDQDNMSLVLAVASNAKESEVNYFNFENGSSSGEYYTGQRSVSSFSETTPSADPIHGTKYKVGVWVKGSGATVNGVAVPGRNNANWVFYQVTLHNNTNVSGSGGHFDDLTIIPTYGAISYFAYDPLTWKVTAMTGPDHRTSFYEYDDAGRLMGVRDQDRKLLQTNEYAYGQMHYIDTEANNYALFDEITFTLNTVGSPVAAIPPYTWSFGDGVQLQTTAPSVTHFYHVGGSYPVSVSFDDENNITRRTSKILNIAGELQINLSLLSVDSICEPSEISCDPSGDTYEYWVKMFSDTEGGLEPYTYEWYAQDYDQNNWTLITGQDGPNAEIQWTVTNTNNPELFRIKLKVTDALGTSQEATYTVQAFE